MRTRLMRKRARSGLRRYWRRTRLQRYGGGARRRVMRAVARRPQRPELKWLTLEQANVDTSNGVVYSTNITPTVMTTGPNEGNRIGNQVTFIKFDFNLGIQNNSPVSVIGNAPQVQSGRYRIIIWTPRVRQKDALAYMNGLAIYQTVDPNMVTRHRDVISQLSPPYMGEETSNDIAGGPFAYAHVKRFKVPFPRKVKFASSVASGDTINDLDEDRYVCYFTLISDLIVRMNIHTRLYYFDS